MKNSNIAKICDSIIELNKLENYMVDRLEDIKKYFHKEEKVYLEVLLENIDEFDWKLGKSEQALLEKLSKKYL